VSPRQRVGHGAYNAGPTQPRPPQIVHLRTGADTSFPGPACGIDSRVQSRLGRPGKVNLTDDPDQVTCTKCRRSLGYFLMTRSR